MKTKIHLSDIQLLLQLFGPKQFNLLIFDPFQKLIADVKQSAYIDDPNRPLVLVNLANEVSGYKGLELDEFEMILDFGRSEVSDVFKQKEFEYINNTNGTLRWLYPKGKPKAALSFYNTSSTKSKLISRGIKIAQLLKIGKFISNGRCTVHHQKELKTNQIFHDLEHSEFSLFTGTKGYNRTPVFALQNKGLSTYFVKIAIDKVGLRSLKNESQQLDYVKQFDLKTAHIPESVPTSTADILITKNVTHKRVSQSNKLTKLHFRFLREINNKTARVEKINETAFWDNLQDNLNISKQVKKPQYLELYKALDQLSTEINPTEEILTSLSHSDFTPWNIKSTNQELYVYDWEMSNRRSPALFDLIHFIFQTGIILQKKSISEIIETLKKKWANKEIISISKTLNFRTYLKLYLLKVASYHLATFQLQSEITKEQKLQLECWTDVVQSLIQVAPLTDQRKVFLKDFQRRLNQTRYAMLKYLGQNLESLPLESDLDIAVLKADISSISNYCTKHVLVEKCIVTHKSFMTIIEVFFKNGAFLSIDLIHQIKRKSIQMMDILPLLTSATPNKNGIRVADKIFDAEYAFLFYVLNDSSIPLKYHALFGSNNEEKQRTFNYLNNKFKLNLTNYDQLFYTQDKSWSKIRSTVLQSNFQSRTLRTKNSFNYLIDSVKAILFKKGFIITLSGVDGVGKSTIVKSVQQQLQQKYRKEVVLMRHRPGILPILSTAIHGSKSKAEKVAGDTIPRKGTNRNLLSSILRFSYYYTDYLLGQTYIYFKYVIRGKIVLYDRYYFDFIVDSERSNIRLNKGIIKRLYAFVYKPKLNILLWADPSSVYSRKKELEPDTIFSLTNDYKKLFTAYNSKYEQSKYQTIENKDLDQTVSSIMKEFMKVA
jgi:thymidylate kinase